MLAFAGSIGLGAFLLFQVQPLLGKYILPWFGGGPGVWSACLLFFQVGLLGGYLYAHLLSRRFSPRSQCIIHCALLLLALCFLPITPEERWKPQPGANPVLSIMMLLFSVVGLPYMLLAATGPLLQSWLAFSRPGARVYRLYALSNAASVAALLSYPFYFELHATRNTQAQLWSWGFLAYAVLCGLVAILNARRIDATAHQEHPVEAGRPVGSLRRVLWILFPACGTTLLMAVTNKLCQDVAVVPFLWVLPLTLYLVSFIVAFDSPRWYARLPFAILLAASMAALFWVMRQGTNVAISRHIVIYSGALLVCCTVCHAELFRLRPRAVALTGFYLAIAAGGAMGGIFVALAAPLIFNGYYELHIGMIMCAVLFVLVCAMPKLAAEPLDETRTWRWLSFLLPLLALAGLDFWLYTYAKSSSTAVSAKGALLALRIGLWCVGAFTTIVWFIRRKTRVFGYWRFVACLWMAAMAGALGVMLWGQARATDSDIIYKSRTFYGVLTVYDHNRQDPLQHHTILQHGGITHGLQLRDPDQENSAVSYYSEESGIGKAFAALPGSPRRIGAVGLGTGTLAVYARAGDSIRFYEINPEVERIARHHFTYISKCAGQVSIALGDARLSLEREPPADFDILALDAFSSDAIPSHLLTREAFHVYMRHLTPGGIIAVHVSNHYLDLPPVVRALAREFGLYQVLVDFEAPDEDWWNYSSTWILLTRSKEVLATEPIRSVLGETAPLSNSKDRECLWTDDFTSLYQILK